MRSGRLGVYVVLLLLAVVLLSSSPSEEEAVPGAVKTPGTRVAERVTAELPAGEAVRVPAGAIVGLRVRADEADEAEIIDLGISWPVGGGIEGTTEFVAARPGRYPVTLRDAGERVGTLVVTGGAPAG